MNAYTVNKYFPPLVSLAVPNEIQLLKMEYNHLGIKKENVFFTLSEIIIFMSDYGPTVDEAMFLGSIDAGDIAGFLDDHGDDVYFKVSCILVRIWKELVILFKSMGWFFDKPLMSLDEDNERSWHAYVLLEIRGMDFILRRNDYAIEFLTEEDLINRAPML